MGQEGQRGFSAFVSYSHADKAAAQKLHRRLEGYRLPKHVAAQLAATTSSDDPAKLGQIFRDREDLPAAQDLSESVKAALQVSAALIVLCSPAAKASKWVAREIETFRELHPDRPILAALLEGEPEEAFPEPLLQGREPLAADLRKEGDGPRLGFLKIVAGIAGVPLDALVQRDAHRRMRRVMAVTGGAVTAMLAMAIMTFVAIQSRNEAQKQREGAEGLVEFMFTDLRPQLRGVGRIDVMESVNKRAIDYYSVQGDLTKLPDDSLQRYARILHAMGEDFEALGALDESLEKFTEAHRVTKSLLARSPQNPDRIFTHGQSEYWLGRVDELRENYPAAAKAYKAYQGKAQELHAIEPGTRRSMMEMAWGHLNIGIVTFKSGKGKSGAGHLAALAEFEKAISWFTRIAKNAPEDQEVKYELANAYSWAANVHYERADYWKSQDNQLIAVKLKREISAADPKNKDALYSLFIGQRALALNHEKLGNAAKAAGELGGLVEKVRQLRSSDPENTGWSELLKDVRDDYFRLRQ